MDESPLLRIRTAAGMSRAKMGLALRVSRARVHAVETRDTISAPMAFRLLERFPRECEALRLTLEHILMHRRMAPKRRARRSGRGKAQA